jgi:hypothetical protein
MRFPLWVYLKYWRDEEVGEKYLVENEKTVRENKA